jgi:hypothetical protein
VNVRGFRKGIEFMPDNTDRKRAEEIAREAFVLARGAIRQTTIMRKQGGSDEEIGLLCDLLKEFDMLVKRELSEHLSPRIVAFASEVRAEQRERDARIVEDFDEWVYCTCSECRADAGSHAVKISTSAEKIAAAIRAEVEP